MGVKHLAHRPQPAAAVSQLIQGEPEYFGRQPSPLSRSYALQCPALQGLADACKVTTLLLYTRRPAAYYKAVVRAGKSEAKEDTGWQQRAPGVTFPDGAAVRQGAQAPADGVLVAQAYTLYAILVNILILLGRLRLQWVICACLYAEQVGQLCHLHVAALCAHAARLLRRAWVHMHSTCGEQLEEHCRAHDDAVCRQCENDQAVAQLEPPFAASTKQHTWRFQVWH